MKTGLGKKFDRKINLLSTCLLSSIIILIESLSIYAYINVSQYFFPEMYQFAVELNCCLSICASFIWAARFLPLLYLISMSVAVSAGTTLSFIWMLHSYHWFGQIEEQVFNLLFYYFGLLLLPNATGLLFFLLISKLIEKIAVRIKNLFV